MKFALLCSFLIFCLPFPPVSAKLFNADSFMLDNGLEVIVIENRRAPVVSHMVWYKVGSINDPLGKAGIAHVLEHMMFKGTSNVPDGEFSKIIARNGGEENAFTSYDFTGYYQNIARDRLELVMFLEADRMRNLRLREQDFAPELEVVKEERLMRTDNNPAMILRERRSRTLWGEHPYGRPVIGTRKELDALQLKDAEQFYQTYYAPDNAILIVAGDISAEELKPLAEKYYGKVAPSRTPIVKKPLTESYPVRSKIEMNHPQVQINTFDRTYTVPSYLLDRSKGHAYAVLGEILGASHVGKLYKYFVIQHKKATYFTAYYDGFSLDKGTFSFYAVAANGVPLKNLEQDLNKFLKKLKITDKDVEKAKTRLIAGMEFVNDNPQTAANLIGRIRVLGISLDDIQSWPEAIQVVSSEDVRKALNELLSSQSNITTYLMPEEKTK